VSNVKTKAPPLQAVPVNLQPFFYGRSFIDAAHEKDSFKTVKRCMGLIKNLALQMAKAGYNQAGMIFDGICRGRIYPKRPGAL
jgi:hypothetical protein